MLLHGFDGIAVRREDCRVGVDARTFLPAFEELNAAGFDEPRQIAERTLAALQRGSVIPEVVLAVELTALNSLLEQVRRVVTGRTPTWANQTNPPSVAFGFGHLVLGSGLSDLDFFELRFFLLGFFFVCH